MQLIYVYGQYWNVLAKFWAGSNYGIRKAGGVLVLRGEDLPKCVPEHIRCMKRVVIKRMAPFD